MFNNHLYNLMMQLTEEHKSLWRIKKEYKKDSKGCRQCLSFWKKMEADKEDHIRELGKLIRGHM